ncbi:MAG: flagellar biosynthesis protein FlhB [Succinivibrionaceae bacterium]|nr:flagellar biosynthesis protein FlhB [Succinivibrionaceae bacterium]
MAESDGQEKTEQPTDRRLQQAREKGQIPRSREAQSFAVLLGGVAGLAVFSGWFVSAFRTIFSETFGARRETFFDPTAMVRVFTRVIIEIALPVICYSAVVFVCALIGSIAVGGMNFSQEGLMPKFQRINPLSGIKRIFSMQSIVELVKSVLKVVCIGAGAYIFIRMEYEAIMTLPSLVMPEAQNEAMAIFFKILIGVVCAMIPIVLIDVPYQKWHHISELKMTKQEIKDEMKDTEGKPEVKSRIRQLQYQMANRRMMANVPKADVVVTNPTHYSVAIIYERDKPHSAPYIAAMGVDEIAFKIREIAREYDVPIIEAPPLARSLYYNGKLDTEIPEGLFAAVAQVLAYVYQLKMYKSRQGGAPRPLPKVLPIPENLRHD